MLSGRVGERVIPSGSERERDREVESRINFYVSRILTLSLSSSFMRYRWGQLVNTSWSLLMVSCILPTIGNRRIQVTMNQEVTLEKCSNQHVMHLKNPVETDP